ncbi:MAG: diamine N-acetyltransferase [Oceanotoga sp.]|uniref:UDP-4-amino-4, 6-dideoxy-N-acetyl-beta-L-altrosamine N-acetyltransferase n=1 Tax=Oceanotoga sp. TaxID=2108366 RepID=UPI0026561448|nr:UDP-4-amino-4,6-dideoxy-N-acetyl-beta-L-altrosamine N-acetyltransferase [Oceanotoga sp.]MDN5341370.1 diamine N-acetyltransferase [Oceanotoga sp.]
MLKNKEIELIPISKEDTEYIINIRNTKKINENLFSNPPIYDFEHIKWLNQMNKNDIHLIIKNKDEKVGIINITKIDYLNEKCEYGIALEPQYSGKGIAYKASKLLLNYVFSNLKIRKVYLELFSDNIRAKSLYEKIGFKQEGFFKEEIFKNGKFRDVIRMACYKSEWKNENSI